MSEIFRYSPVLAAFLALSLSGWAVLAQKRVIVDAGPGSPSPRTATLWEYKIVGLQGAMTLNVDDLNRLGSEGCELVGVQRDETTIVARGSARRLTMPDRALRGTYYYFKRAKP